MRLSEQTPTIHKCLIYRVDRDMQHVGSVAVGML